jgi:demethylmenaquinone methyltransferase/2-methoxy-6-polyprenyl-1,4-benzoquinol methylase
MFSDVAPRYDLMNDLSSLGQDRRWRHHVVDALAPQEGELILDLAAGTGASGAPITRTGAKVIAVDLTEAMVRVGKGRHPNQVFVVGDGSHLPFSEGCFDAATMSFGLRNVSNPEMVLREISRVVRPGGTLVICEFSHPVSWVTRVTYQGWLKFALPLMSKVASSRASAYDYLGDSILDWHDQRGLAVIMEKAGWTGIQWRNLSGGIVALHRGVRP